MSQCRQGVGDIGPIARLSLRLIPPHRVLQALLRNRFFLVFPWVKRLKKENKKSNHSLLENNCLISIRPNIIKSIMMHAQSHFFFCLRLLQLRNMSSNRIMRRHVWAATLKVTEGCFKMSISYHLFCNSSILFEKIKNRKALILLTKSIIYVIIFRYERL